MNRVASVPFSQLLVEKNKKKHQIERKKASQVCFSTMFSPQYKQICNIIQKHLPVLYTHDNLWNILKTGVKCTKKLPLLDIKSLLVYFLAILRVNRVGYLVRDFTVVATINALHGSLVKKYKILFLMLQARFMQSKHLNI